MQRSKYEGRYEIIRGERGGRPIPEQEIAGSMVVFDGNTITGTDKDKKQFFACEFAIDGGSKPERIAMISTAPHQGARANGVIELASDGGVRICYGLPGAEAPTSFKTNDQQQFFELKRISQ